MECDGATNKLFVYVCNGLAKIVSGVSLLMFVSLRNRIRMCHVPAA